MIASQRPYLNLRPWAWALPLLMVAPQQSFAHTVIEGVSGFPSGLLHPLFVPAHAMSLVALSLLIGSRKREHCAILLATFAAALTGAIVLIALAYVATNAEIVLLACAAASGLMVATGQRPLALSGVLTAATALALQFDSVPAIVSMSETLQALAGSALSAFTTALLLIAAVIHVRRPWLLIGIRIAGSWIAAITLLVLALKLR